MLFKKILSQIELPKDLAEILAGCPELVFANTVEELVRLSVRDAKDGWHVVSYDVPGKGEVKEAEVCRAKNGIAANYFEPYMRRRDPEAMLIGDDGPTDKVRYNEVFNKSFDGLRSETLSWLKNQKLAAFIFMAGQIEAGIPSLAIVPANAGFFAFGLAKLQGILDARQLAETFQPKCFLFVAPPFRHSLFGGRQHVIHNRLQDRYEIFSYSLYPGPSAKKGIYGALLHYGETEGWVTNHAAVVRVVTPYGNKLTIMHEAASGGGKSEMNEHIHRESDGTIHFGTNVVTGEKRYLAIPRACDLQPVIDDMALCHPSLQKNNGKLTVFDAEHGWFIRVDHIKNYGADPDIESLSIHPKVPLLFLNIDAQPSSTALLWEHVEDSPGNPCPNPRFVLPRKIVPDIVNKPVSVDIRSFGVRTPPSTAQKPSYGIFGIFHVIPPALAWLWRLASPRGFDNPSILDSEGMASEGVGSYWPFATGKRVNHANLILKQIVDNPKTHYVLCPNKHIGAWRVGFMPQWIMRDYLARRGGVRFTQDELSSARSPLLGYALNRLVVEGQVFDQSFLKVEHQIGEAAYDAGAKILADYFKAELTQFLDGALDLLGQKIVDCCLSGGSLDDYSAFIESAGIFIED
jgi:hypothetical protein